MPEIRRCPQCGAELPADAPEGVCPKCLLGLGFGSQPPGGPSSQLASAGAEHPEPANGPAPTSPFTSRGGFVAPEPADLAKHFPQLEILELLGQGGMGAVYKARQPGLDRLVALKILPPEVGQDPAFAERFMREARALAKLSHQNIVTVYDFGQAGGLYYFIMEIVDGLNLRRMIAKGQLEPPEALAIVPQICDALQFAHDEGVVHRDIKPENILLDKKGRVKIADFGLAKLVGVGQAFQPDSPVSLERLTYSGQVMGTPHYMAPEQVERPMTVDHRADIYSLGVVFYEMLTGELPLGRFALPSQKVQIDVRLDEVVVRALEKEPERRYQHASDVKTDVESISRSPQPPPPVAPAGGSKTRPRSVAAGLSFNSAEPAAVALRRRIPIAAWIGLVPFVVILVAAFAELQHQADAAIARAVALASLCFAAVYLGIYAVIALVRRSRRVADQPPFAEPRPWRIAMFFSLLLFFTALVVINWVGNPFGSTAGHFSGPLWILSKEGPTLTDEFARHLELQPDQKVAVTRSLRAFYRDFRLAEERNTLRPYSGIGHQIAMIAPMGDEVATPKERFWSELDAVLTKRRLIGEAHARLWGIEYEMFRADAEGFVSEDRLLDGPGGHYWSEPRFPYVDFRIEIWREANFYHWRLKRHKQTNMSPAGPLEARHAVPDADEVSFGPQLPDEYRRFWKEPEAVGADDAQAWHEFGAALRRPVQPLPDGSVPPTHVAFSSDGKTLIALIGQDVHSWEREQVTSLGRRPIGDFIHGARSGTLSPFGESITLVRPGGPLVGADGTVELWKVANGERLAEVHPGAALYAAFAPDRRVVAVACEDGSMKLWDVASDSQRSSLESGAPVTALAFSGDGALLAGACGDGTIQLWEVESGDFLTALEGLSSAATCVAFAPDGARLAAGTRDGTVQLWLVETATREAAIASQAGLSSVAFSPNGWTLATGSVEGMVQRWLHFGPERADEKASHEPPLMRLLRVGQIGGSVDDPFIALAIHGKYAYLIQGDAGEADTRKSLRVVDVSEPSRPRMVGSCDLTVWAGKLTASGQYVCLLDEPNLRVVDVSDPLAPRTVGSCELGGHLWDLAVQGQYAFVTDVASVRVVDFSDPAAPKEVGRCEVEEAEGITVAGQYAYVACNIEGMRIVDISDPTVPKVVTPFEGPQGAADVAVAGNYAYIAGGEDAVTLWIADISDPTNPKSVGRYGDWIAGSVAVEGDYAYIAGGELEIVDVSNPAIPKRAGHYDDAQQVAVAGNYVYVVGEEGFSIFRAVRTKK